MKYYGLPMEGLDKAVKTINEWAESKYNGYVQVSYDMETGEVLTTEHTDENSRTNYSDPAILFCGIYGCRHMSNQALADKIHETVAFHLNPEVR